MPRVIEPGCVKCGACTADCPVEAIYEGETQFYVDPAICIDCGKKLADKAEPDVELPAENETEE